LETGATEEKGQEGPQTGEKKEGCAGKMKSGPCRCRGLFVSEAATEKSRLEGGKKK